MMVTDLANDAYEAGLRRDLNAAREAINRIVREHGGTALQQAMILWVDRTITALGMQPGTLAGFTLSEDGDDTDLDIDTVDPAVAWAGRMFAARLARDKGAWHALLRSLPIDRQVISEHVFALLSTMTLTASKAQQEGAGQRRACCAMHATEDPATTAARQAVAHLN